MGVGAEELAVDWRVEFERRCGAEEPEFELESELGSEMES